MEYVFQRLLDIVRFVNFNGAIDIAILSVVIYKIIWATRKNSFGRVIKGVGVLLIVMLLANYLKLYAITSLFNALLEYGLLAVVVIFQPEIRRFLEQMGDNRLFNLIFTGRSRDLGEVEHSIAHTVRAYTSLSKDKVGALIVFERRTHLDDVIKTGTALDAAVTDELLKNIFWNKAPLHDGAVVVRNGRIIGAGCMLPLSANVNLSRELGMRHRAGIGISENSDAVVAIVSEETGSISVAVDGMLKRHLAPETFDRLLRNELLNDAEAGDNVSLATLISSAFARGKKEGGQGE